MGKISAAIVSYGGYEEVMRAVESLVKYAGPDFITQALTVLAKGWKTLCRSPGCG